MKIKINGSNYDFKEGTNLEEIKEKLKIKDKDIIVGAIVNNVLSDLSKKLTNNSVVKFLTINDEIGNRIYRRSLFLVLCKSIYELFPEAELSIEHSLGNGIYCELYKNNPLVQKDVTTIKYRMKEIIEDNHRIQKKVFPINRLEHIFKSYGFEDKIDMIKQMNLKKYIIYELDGYYDYYFYNMVPETGYLNYFDLYYRIPGFVMLFPQRGKPHKISKFADQPKLASVFHEYERWGKIINIENAGDLNKITHDNKSADIIRINEALHEKKIANIADDISRQMPDKRIILISGPSSSGKTTFAQRLSIQLRVNGLNPVNISTDNYFVDRKNTPINEDGDYDFESIEAIDMSLFNEHLVKLIQGKKIEIPFYNFKKGEREMRGLFLQITEEQPLIIEGIHSLNERLTSVIPSDNKYRIYISALTQLNLDRHNRIPTTDTRIIRRIIRDYHFRGHSADMTIKWWPNVRKGEEKNIFPFQENADIMFNSALIYELAVLKNYAEPLLKEISPETETYYQALRLLEILSCFQSMPEENIPSTSILKEFIGGSAFSI